MSGFGQIACKAALAMFVVKLLESTMPRARENVPFERADLVEADCRRSRPGTGRA